LLAATVRAPAACYSRTALYTPCYHFLSRNSP